MAATAMPAEPVRAAFMPPAAVEEAPVEKRAEGVRRVEFKTRCGPPAGCWRLANGQRA